MTIGVFGDSFADPGCQGGQHHTAWFFHLGSPASSYGLASTSLLWSYRRFLEHHEKHDRNVFIMTSPMRADHFGDTYGTDFIHNLDLALRILKEGKYSSIKNWRGAENETVFKDCMSNPQIKMLGFHRHFLRQLPETYRSKIIADFVQLGFDVKLIGLIFNSAN